LLLWLRRGRGLTCEVQRVKHASALSLGVSLAALCSVLASSSCPLHTRGKGSEPRAEGAAEA